jgi:iron(III) transport system substrate-binding protein
LTRQKESGYDNGNKPLTYWIYLMSLCRILFATACAAIASPAVADVNIYTTRQPDLIAPVMDAFTAETGIVVNLAFVDDGLVERLKARANVRLLIW